MIRAFILLVVLAIALAACDRFVNLSPPPDASDKDAAHVPDAHSLSDGGIGDASIPPD